ncbi:glycoside hydrolase family 32 protein [Rhizobium sp. NLR17b]|uniref:glycoside hydrolase family 32 protein n=1 Tax=Rhizobium sp. NLR17b TaxID=2731114 RepID=UPI001C82E690|nr:glycoside hydrolase family 32 protein [Rhizobium sp. NLR17b]MBX5272696.1 glycoside hydrolase family 32 protein [Rhizobium sp. NLR17b]
MSEDLQFLVATAEQSITAAAVVAETDMSRPLYHFRAPSQWMDDPNGIIFHDGWYHMMYSLNPHSAEHRAGMVYKTAVRVWDPNSEDWTGGITVWGHARSRDLVHWEHLPIAVYPSVDRGEHFVWFGCTVINDEGEPMAFYTAVGPELRPEDTATQWAAVGSSDLMTWKPHPSNPLLTYDLHGNDRIGEWRDPFIFKEEGRTFMVLGGRTRGPKGERPVVALYEALNPAYSQWIYRGIIFTHPSEKVPSAECPNLFKLDGKWILLVSPHAEVEYYIGKLDLENYTFTVESSGIADFSRNFYATNVLYDDEKRVLCWGALVGFKGTRGWNCCVSLPRELRVDSNHLIQRPASELAILRDEAKSFEVTLMGSQNQPIATFAQGEALEIEVTVDQLCGSAISIELTSESGTLLVGVSKDRLKVDTLEAAISLTGDAVKFRLFIDRTLAEIFVNDHVCAARVIPLISGETVISVSGASGAKLNGTAWRLNAGQLFTSLRP